MGVVPKWECLSGSAQGARGAPDRYAGCARTNPTIDPAGGRRGRGQPRRQVTKGQRTHATGTRPPRPSDNRPNVGAAKWHGLAYVGAHPRPQCRTHARRFGQHRLRFASLAWIGSDAASGTAARQRAAGCSMCRPQWDRLQYSARVCNRCAAASHLCCAEVDVTEGSGGTDVGLGMDLVPV